MIELQISPDIESHQLLKEKLEKMSLARTVVESSETIVPLLKEGTEAYQGYETINTFLTDYQGFVNEWYACRCDKYE